MERCGVLYIVYMLYKVTFPTTKYCCCEVPHPVVLLRRKYCIKGVYCCIEKLQKLNTEVLLNSSLYN